MEAERGDACAAGSRGVRSWGSKRRDTWWREGAGSAALAVAVFSTHLWLAFRLDRLGLFERFNTLFGADPNLRLESLRRGDALFRLPHPGLSYLLGIPIRALGRVAAAVLPGDPAPDPILRGIALGVAPLASALVCLILLRLLRRLGFAFGTAFALTLLSAVSFSAIVFGSMPETHVPSALAIALACALFLRSREGGGFRTELAWLGVGVLASGITITNIVPVAVLYFFRGTHRTGRAGITLARTMGIAALAVVVACAAGLAAEEFLRVRKAPGPGEREWIARYIVPRPLLHYATFPTAIVNGIAPPAPTRVPGFALEARGKPGAGRRTAAAPEKPARPGGATEGGARTGTAPESTAAPTNASGTRAPEESTPGGDGSPVSAPDGASNRAPARGPNSRLARLTLQPSHGPYSLRNLAGIIVVAALVWAALRRGVADPVLASLARASLVIVGFNWALHGFWGDETFLYSQHWHVPLMLLIATLVAVVGRGRRTVVVLLAVAVVAVAASNLVVLSNALSPFAGP
jgi:hypothetical protein